MCGCGEARGRGGGGGKGAPPSPPPPPSPPGGGKGGGGGGGGERRSKETVRLITVHSAMRTTLCMSTTGAARHRHCLQPMVSAETGIPTAKAHAVCFPYT